MRADPEQRVQHLRCCSRMKFMYIGSRITPCVQVVALFGTPWPMLRADFLPSVMLCSSGSMSALEKHRFACMRDFRLTARVSR